MRADFQNRPFYLKTAFAELLLIQLARGIRTDHTLPQWSLDSFSTEQLEISQTSSSQPQTLPKMRTCTS